MTTIRVILPHHLRRLAKANREIEIEVRAPITQHSVLESLEHRFPSLQGTLRDHSTQRRRPYVRFFADGQDISHNSAHEPLPDAVQRGAEPFLIIGAMAGG